MGVPSGPAVNAFVDDGVAHDGSGEFWCVDANQKDSLGVSPFPELFSKEGTVAEFDCDFLCSGFFDEAFQRGDIGKRGRELEQIIVDSILKRSEEFFEPLKPFNGCVAEFLEMGNRAVDFDDPGEVFSFCRPGFYHVGVRESVEAHVQLDSVEP